MRLFAIMLVFAVAVLWPINHTYEHSIDVGRPKNETGNGTEWEWGYSGQYGQARVGPYGLLAKTDDDGSSDSWLYWNKPYLWSYLAFTWFFSILTLYYMDHETFRIIKVRQDYLGTQSTVTDRTFRLAGIPRDLRTEDKIKQFVENLEIGKVKSVTLCRNWAEIDALMARRKTLLRQLEESWSVYLAKTPASGTRPARNQHATPHHDAEGGNQEDGPLLAGENLQTLMTERPRPQTRIWYGFLGLQSRRTDAIDYYEEKLRRLDEKIRAARKKEHRPTATAFVTMDTIASCQMAIQAVVDPRPGKFLSKPAPAPTDVVWRNTYTPMWRRRLQSWTITIFITFLTLIWLIPVATLAGLLSICTIEKVSPALAEALLRHETTKALVQTALPVGVVSLLSVSVPYLYDYLANQQGMISQGDVELSVVSKNFFFIFFNVFLVFAVFGTTSKFWPVLRDSLRDTQFIALTLAKSIQTLSNFYLNFIMLQAFGLLPFKLLQFGDVAQYAILRMGAKTPRDFAEIAKPTLFNYGHYLPTALLVCVLCLVYSVLPGCHLVLFIGVCYFFIGFYVHKYHLLYSMDQPQHATGGAWRIICYRLMLGLVIFQVVMAGILSLRGAFYGAALVTPILMFTVWYSYFWGHRYKPLTVFIALRSINRATDPGIEGNLAQDVEEQAEEMRLARQLSTVDEDREKGMRFVNPNMVAPLEQPWIYPDQPPPLSGESINLLYGGSPNGTGPNSGRTSGTNSVANSGLSTPNRRNGMGGGIRSASESSSFSLGDTHVWRDNGDSHV